MRIEVAEYAQYLGIDPQRDKDLLWIAKEGLKAPLPEPWKPCKTPQEEIYYFNFQTGESIWEHPCDQYYKQLFKEEKAKKSRNSQAAKEPRKQSPATAAPTAGGPKPAAAIAPALHSRQSYRLNAAKDVILC